jgi:hypothetical protein
MLLIRSKDEEGSVLVSTNASAITLPKLAAGSAWLRGGVYAGVCLPIPL